MNFTNASPNPDFWANLLMWIGGEMAAIALLAGIGQSFVRSPTGRKIIWRAAVVVALLAVAAEVSGLVPAAGQWLKQQLPQSPPPPNRTVTVQVTTGPAIFDLNESLPAAAALVQPPVKTKSAIWWPAWIWLGGTSVILAYRLMAGALFLRLRRRMHPLVDDGLADRVQRLAVCLNLTKPVRLFSTAQVAGPFTFGWWRPAIGLAESFTRDFTAAQQDAILAHELGHIAGRDFLWQRISTALLASLWWHPAAWWMHRQLATANEHAADEASLLVENGPDALAESLVILGRKMSHRLQPILLGVEGAGFRSALAKRVHRLWAISDRQFCRTGRRHLMMAIAGGALSLGSLALVATVLPRQGAADATRQRSLIGMAAEALAKPQPPADALSASLNKTAPPPVRTSARSGESETNAVVAKQMLIKERLTNIILSRFSCDGTKLRDVVSDLAAQIRKTDPAYDGITFLVDDEAVGIPIHIPLMTNISIIDALNVIEKVAKPQIKWSIEDYGVGFLLALPDRLYTRVFKLNANMFHSVTNAPKTSTTVWSERSGGGYQWMTVTNASADGAAMLAYFKAHGVAMEPPKTWHLTVGAGLLMVRASLEDLDAVEKALAAAQTGQDKIPVPGDVSQIGRLARSNQVELTVTTQDADGVLDYDKSTGIATAEKGVVVQYGDVKLKAKKITINDDTGQVLAEGDVQLLSAGNKFNGDRLSYDFRHDRILAPASVIAKSPTKADASMEKTQENLDRERELVKKRIAEASAIYTQQHPVLFALNRKLDELNQAIAAAEPVDLLTKIFKVEPATLASNLKNLQGLSSRRQPAHQTNFVAGFTDLLAGLGVKIEPPKSVYFNERNGQLLVRASKADMATIEKALQLINQAPPQLTIEARFCEVATEDGKAPDFEKLIGISLTNALPPVSPALAADTNAAAATLTGILSAAQYKEVLRRLEKQKGVDILSVPKVTTLSGRQAQIKVVDIKYVVTGLAPNQVTNSPTAKSKPGEPVPVTEPFEFGPVLDVVPWVLADGQSIQMTVIPSVLEFLGYDEQWNDNRGRLPRVHAAPQPRFRKRVVVCNAAVRDGQTLVLAGGSCFEEVITKGGIERRAANSKQVKSLLIFVTPTLIDAAGNRLHSDEELIKRDLR